MKKRAGGRGLATLTHGAEGVLIGTCFVVPRMEGRALVAVLRAEGHRRPVIALTRLAYGSTPDYASLAADAVLRKPVVPSDLLRTVCRITAPVGAGERDRRRRPSKVPSSGAINAGTTPPSPLEAHRTADRARGALPCDLRRIHGTDGPDRETGHKRILVVDGDQGVREVLTAELEDEGYEVRAAVDGAAALDDRERSAAAPDVVVLDYGAGVAR